MAEDFPDFTLIPVDEEDFSADEELAAFVDADTIPLLSAEPDERQPVGLTWLLDFDTGQLGPRPQVVRGAQSVAMWAFVALRTQRDRHPMFSADFGMDEPDRLIGRVEDTARRAQYVADIKDTLGIHPNITNVGNFHFPSAEDPDDDFRLVDLQMEIDGEEGSEEVILDNVPLPT